MSEAVGRLPLICKPWPKPGYPGQGYITLTQPPKPHGRASTCNYTIRREIAVDAVVLLNTTGVLGLVLVLTATPIFPRVNI